MNGADAYREWHSRIKPQADCGKGSQHSSVQKHIRVRRADPEVDDDELTWRTRYDRKRSLEEKIERETTGYRRKAPHRKGRRGHDRIRA